MRACDSQHRHRHRIGVAPPVFTRAMASEGCCDGGRLQGRVDGVHQRHRVAARHRGLRADERQRAAPARRPCAMPYIGLMVLDWVSFCDIAGITAPLVPARSWPSWRLGENTAQDGAVGVPQEPERVADEGARSRHHVARHAELAEAGGRQEVGLSALHAHQRLGADEIRAAGQIEADERHTGRRWWVRCTVPTQQRLDIGSTPGARVGSRP